MLAFLWGWPLVAGALALCWGGLLWPGELTAGLRSDLVLPADVEYSLYQRTKDEVHSGEARVCKVEHLTFCRRLPLPTPPSDEVEAVARLKQLLEALRVPAVAGTGSRHLELASLRAGGASWMACEDPGWVQRRGRWLSSRVFEIYIQEVGTLQFLPALPEEARYRIRQALHNVLRSVRFLQDSGIAPCHPYRHNSPWDTAPLLLPQDATGPRWRP